MVSLLKNVIVTINDDDDDDDFIFRPQFTYIALCSTLSTNITAT